jgi:chromosomal replication initiator protein
MSVQVYDTQTVEQIWQMAKADLESSLSPAFYNTWILPSPLTEIQIQDEQKAVATITCMTAFHVANLQSNLYLQIKTALEKYIHKPLEIKFVVGDPRAQLKKEDNTIKPDRVQSSQPSPSPKSNNKDDFQTIRQAVAENLQFQTASSPNSPTVEQLFSQANIQNTTVDRLRVRCQQIGIRPDYTFKTFAVSSSNEMAHAAASNVANNPGTSYNPLFLYGGVGVGKTHLMHAVANHILSHNPEAEIIYTTGEQFTNEIVRGIRSRNTLQIKTKYRHTAVLLIDDIQFIAGKNSIQEEFFHTFNALTANNAQIILTSDRPPQEISLLEDRLRSRFEAGLMIDIQQPTFELRTAILLLKAQSNKINIPIDLAQQIAAQVDSARKIEGIVKRLRSAVELQNASLDAGLVEKILQTEKKNNSQKVLRVKPADVIKTVANHYHLKQSAVKGKSRSKELVKARHIAMFLLRSELQVSLEEIGEWFSGRDHSSVIHAIRKIEEDALRDGQLQQDLSALKMSLAAISN